MRAVIDYGYYAAMRKAIDETRRQIRAYIAAMKRPPRGRLAGRRRLRADTHGGRWKRPQARRGGAR
jgi:hypothetical protein